MVYEAEPNLPKSRDDTGLNVVAATSSGHTFGADFKSKFNKLYDKVKIVGQIGKGKDLKIIAQDSPGLNQSYLGLQKVSPEEFLMNLFGHIQKLFLF